MESQKQTKRDPDDKSIQNEESENNKTSVSDINREKNPTHVK